jgi:putative flippase GtrA
MSALEAPTGLLHSVAQRRGVRQFVKFCIVGASSTAIDFLVFFLLIEVVHLHQFTASPDLARATAVCCAFGVAVTNGFYWNNRWTFRAGETEGARSRYAKFVLTNLVGLALNLSITLLLARFAPAPVVALLGQFLHKDPAAFFGKAVATLIVVFWNFTASKYWTFKS